MRHATVLLLASIALCNGCGQKQTPPLVLRFSDCPTPASPVLPVIDGSESLESPANIARIMERDDRIRAYIDGLESALSCYEAQVQTKEEEQ